MTVALILLILGLFFLQNRGFLRGFGMLLILVALAGIVGHVKG
jgi:hypothetical protein